MREVDIDTQLSAVDRRIKQLQDKRQHKKKVLRCILKESEEVGNEVKMTREELLVLYDISLKVGIKHTLFDERNSS